MKPSDTSRPHRPSRVPSVASGMREELRASLVKCFFLALCRQKGEAHAKEVVELAELDPTMLEQETSWLSVDTARRVILALATELGPTAFSLASEEVANPENLGPWVRMIREVKTPQAAFSYFIRNAQEHTRVGEFELHAVAPPLDAPSVPSGEGHERSDADDRESHAAVAPDATSFFVVYRPRPDEPPEQDDLLSKVREMVLSGLPLFLGRPLAKVRSLDDVSRGAEVFRYEVTLTHAPLEKFRGPLYAGGAFVLGAGAVFPFGRLPGGLVAGAVCAGLGYGAAVWLGRFQSLERERAFEKVRIAALERGLSLRGEGTMVTPGGDLENLVLGGKYRIGKRIGSGGIGVVHAAEHLGLGTQVAIKVLRGAAAKDGAEIARLRREAQVSSALDHPNVVKVLDLDQLQDGSIYVVMELLRGRSLAEKLHREGPLGPGYAVDVFRQVCLALAAAHEIGVVHRDLKPGNVFLCEDGETAKVLDFGMSKLGAGFVGNEKLTQDGYTLGTPEYMAPEQCIGAPVEPRTDLYELGVLIYEALTGDLPIKSHNRRELLDLHQRQIPPRMRERRPDLPIPQELDDAVAQCLKKRMNDRPASALELEGLLAEVPLEGVPYHYPKNVGRTASRSKNRDVSAAEPPTTKAR